jgi:hypothetical protein
MKAFIAIILSVFVVSCAQKNDATQTITTTAGQYSYINGACYDYTNKQYVTTSFCTTTTASTGYQLSNGICYSTSTGQQVDNSYCSSNTTTGSQCIGVYIYNGQYVQCNGSNCRGYTLIQATTGTPVTCQ